MIRWNVWALSRCPDDLEDGGEGRTGRNALFRHRARHENSQLRKRIGRMRIGHSPFRETSRRPGRFPRRKLTMTTPKSYSCLYHHCNRAVSPSTEFCSRCIKRVPHRYRTWLGSPTWTRNAAVGARDELLAKAIVAISRDEYDALHDESTPDDSAFFDAKPQPPQPPQPGDTTP